MAIWKKNFSTRKHEMSISEASQESERERGSLTERGQAELERLKCQFEVYYLLDTSTYWLHRPFAVGKSSRTPRRSVGRAGKRDSARESEWEREIAANCFSKYNKIRAKMGSCSRRRSRSRCQVEVGSASEQITWKWMQAALENLFRPGLAWLGLARFV